MMLRLSVAALLLLAALGAAAAPASSDSAAGIKRMIADARHPALKWPDFRFYDDEMQQFYEPLGYGLAWFVDGRPRKQIPEIVAALRAADDQGLNAEDYDVLWLEKQWQAVKDGGRLDEQSLMLFDTALSLNLFRYISDVHIGRVNPRNVGFQVDVQPKKYDLPILVRDGVAADRLPALVAEAEPQYPMYRRLRDVLRRYRALSGDTAREWMPEVTKLKPGQPYAGAGRLARTLAALGDLPAGSAAGASGTYDPELTEAVKRFQDRHGLVPDGVIGRDTFAQLNTPPAARVRQIELAMERMRWLPDVSPGPVIGINIPEFKLWAFDEEGGRLRLQFRMEVVVGKALNTRTPVFADQMEYVVFSPYWNVTPSIARNEVIPAIRKDPGYLEKHDMELVRSATGEPVAAPTGEDTLGAIRRGELRVRQRPGEKNSLGRVKFVFPNNMNIYLHDTPARTLFQRSRRDFSHGCIRVSDPGKLARFVLRDMPEWSDEKIEAAMAADQEQHVRLKRPIPVVIFYTTVIVEEDGLVRFLPDIYGHDQALDSALRAGYPYPP
ncbi:MAG TPA: L,D-transpeptidase family protein [Burkholderiales bacterium]|nr:L,D-transpeptidase family protein [Burkholderiales bacterium]